MQHLGSEVSERILDYKGMEGVIAHRAASRFRLRYLHGHDCCSLLYYSHFAGGLDSMVEKAGDIFGGVDHCSSHM